MAAREQMGQNIDPGIVARVAQGIRYAFTGKQPSEWKVQGVDPSSNWMGPSQPLPPYHQEIEGRALDYPVGYNLRIQPRSEENVSFAQLRTLADAYDLMRLIIETRKDQMEAYEWEVVPREKGEDRADDIKLITDFFEYPDREHSWPQWLRMQIEDLLVLDAICVYPRRTKGGGVWGFELVAPDTIKRVIDETGRTPLPPSPAYQQIIKGIPAADYTTEMLVYGMRNPRTNRLYGFGPVEQVITTVNIALRRQMTQMSFYTEGNVPEALAQVPKEWTARQIELFQQKWDEMNEGNAGAKRRMRFIPSLDNIVFPREAVLKDEFDEWLARIVCFAFSVSPSALIRQVNRASGEQMAETAKEEGLIPLLRFLEMHMTFLIERHLNMKGLRFHFKIVNKVAPDVQAKIDASDVENQIRTPDECREGRGLEPMAPADREKYFPSPMPPVAGVEGPPPNPKVVKPGGAPQKQEPPIVKVELGDTFINVHK